MTPGIEQITRKEAREALHSPEQLDQLMVVTRARGWIALLVVGVAITVAMTWGFFGTISKTVNGRGMLLQDLDPVVIHAQGPARILSFSVAKGDTVEVGQELMKLSDLPLKTSLEAAREQLETLRSNDERLTGREKTQLEISEKEFEKKQVTLQRTIKEAQRLYELQKLQLKAEADLLAEGLIPTQQWIQTQSYLSQLIEQKLNSESQLQQAILEVEQVRISVQQARDERALQIADARSQVNELEARSHMELEVTSPVAGRILEFRVGAYDQVAAGRELVEILPSGGEANRFVAYVDADLGKKIGKGMKVFVSPSIASPERYGYIVGEVAEVAEVISSKAEMARTFENDEFISDILKMYPAPLRIVVTLRPDPETPSGFQWTSSSGLPRKIGIGTICFAEIEVDRDRPMALFIPWLKKSAGIYD